MKMKQNPKILWTILKYHPVRTVLKYHTVRAVLKYHTLWTVLNYHTVRTVLKYHTVRTIPKCQTVQLDYFYYHHYPFRITCIYTSGFRWVSVVKYIVFCVVFCRSLFVLSFCFFWWLKCLSFDLRLFYSFLGVSSKQQLVRDSLYMINL
jgi:hypothetical protein